MNLWIAFFLGLVLGWIIEWLIDFFVTRNRVRRLEGELAAVKMEKAELEGKLIPPPIVEPPLEAETQPIDVIEAEAIPEGNRSVEEIPIAEPEIVDTEVGSGDSGPGISEAVLAGAWIASTIDDSQETVEDQRVVEESGWIPAEESSLPAVDGVEIPPIPEPDLFVSPTLKQEIEYVEGIGPVYGSKLREIGITNGVHLLREGATPKGRAQIASKTGIRPELVLTWVNHSDLYRIKGIGSEYAELLEAAGVDTVVELATRVPQNLYDKMISLNLEKKLVRQVPSLSMVQNWVEQAKTLPRVIVY